MTCILFDNWGFNALFAYADNADPYAQSAVFMRIYAGYMRIISACLNFLVFVETIKNPYMQNLFIYLFFF